MGLSVKGFPSGLVVKNLPAMQEMQQEPWGRSLVGKSSGEGNDNTLQYTCLKIPMDKGAWWATVHGVTKESDMTDQLYGTYQGLGF